MISTGYPGLDKVVSGLQLGDNVVWQIDSIEHYLDFVRPFVKRSLADKRRVVYIRFSNHPALLEKSDVSAVYSLDASLGFESFSTKLNALIKKEGEGVFYVFDCLSDLLSAWSNDLMVGNFFKITCPYLFELNTIAYFSILRASHSFKTVARIRDTTQLLIDVYHYQDNCYVHPLKVWNRYTPTMFLPHIRKKDAFLPIASSAETARLFSHVFQKGERKSTRRKLDHWDRLFMKAEDSAGQKNMSAEKTGEMVEQISRLIISRDEKMLALARKYLSLEQLLSVKSRMIGTGFIGGKSVGMLIARSILQRAKDLQAESLFEPHDSFYIGSDVFYSYVVENGWWNERMEQRTPGGYFKVARALGEKLLRGVFPEEIKEQFQSMIEYFGQSPIIVRSSSLLEDSYGNAFAGKYESVFLANQGTPEQRYARFVEAVHRVYASTMSEDALSYRLQRGLDAMDEQMALLVQRVSGSFHGGYFFPDVAGVGISYNAFVWKNTLDPKAGMLRLVVGLGTRAVNRVEGDYPRIVALDDPLLKAHDGLKDSHRFSQHYVDVIDLKGNALQTVELSGLLSKKVDLHLDLTADKDHETSDMLKTMGRDEEVWRITFDRLLSGTGFGQLMQKMLITLDKAYGHPVDIEFTLNFGKEGEFQFNLLQCRPMQTKGLGVRVSLPRKIARKDVFFESIGHFIGGNVALDIDRVIYVDPQEYCAISSQSGKYDIARAVGELNRGIAGKPLSVMLLGPGRWGTSTPSLGVPVTFSEINHMAVLGEIAFSGGNVMPELSYGTHFFQDLVETGIFYLALFPGNHGVYFNSEFAGGSAASLASFLPQYKRYGRVIRVADLKKGSLRLVSDISTQKVVCYSAHK